MLGFVQALSFPRRVGSPGERQAALYVSRQLQNAGLSVRHERFPVGLAPHEAARLACFTACSSLIIAALLLVGPLPLPAFLLFGLAAWLANAPWRFSRLLSHRVSSSVWSENIVAELPDHTAAHTPCRIVFLAHHDSKSQLLPTGIRVALVASSSLLCWLLALLSLGRSSSLLVLPPSWFLPLASPALVSFLALSLNRTGNHSPGALDNGSGLAVLLELAHSWRPPSQQPAEVLWISTGAEEVALDGARALLSSYEWWWLDKPTLLINLETLGVGSVVRLAGEPSAVALAEHAAATLHIPTRRFSVVGAGMDHEPFAARGLPALSLLGDVVASSFHLHSPRDNLQRVDPSALSRSYLLASHLADSFASQPHPASLTPSRSPR